MATQTSGTLPKIINNADCLYDGNLIHYFRVVFQNATNLQNPYHNFLHTFYVLYLCYQACVYYKSRLTPVEMRELLIAAILHDVNHPGFIRDDKENILTAFAFLQQHLLPEDRASLDNIRRLIKATQYPYPTRERKLTLRQEIIRDADMGQCFNTAWIQQVIFGLAVEAGMEPLEILKRQIVFIY